ncbi:hypothetical protein [Streptomyces sp. NPDC058371]|uniref:hypothetical protein n=1 Tax=Streptomyces sp. NPDC058371 TaxID=3346463 RepID=UPI00365A2E75
MLSYPSILCPDCQSTDLDASLIENSSGGQDIDAFTCRACGMTWKAYESLRFPSAPDYRTAYTGAPELLDEELALMALPDGPAKPDASRLGRRSEHRIHLLRTAAYLDRKAHELALSGFLGGSLDQDVDQAKEEAARAAFELLKRDLEYMDVEGEVHAPYVPPAQPGWDYKEAVRAYVRQEYKAWREE